MALDYKKGTLMFEFKHASGKPTLEDVKNKFGLRADEIDENYGFIPLPRPEGGTYLTVLSEQAGERIEKEKHPDFVQNWPNPQIGPA